MLENNWFTGVLSVWLTNFLRKVNIIWHFIIYAVFTVHCYVWNWDLDEIFELLVKILIQSKTCYHEFIKKKAKAEYIERLIIILNPKLHGEHRFRSMNTNVLFLLFTFEIKKYNMDLEGFKTTKNLYKYFVLFLGS